MSMKQNLNIQELSAYLKVVSDPTRFLILKLLDRNTYCVCELVEMLAMSQPAISQHLRKLKDAQLILEEKREQWRYFTLNKNASFSPIIEELLKLTDEEDERLKQALDKEGVAKC
ncbi:ArsR family transcriptional regulator [Alkalihalobacillus pseudalcaliphilus]|nr:ArsR family transcriptional regulator [Alkalihalobacillus pseudalcaliphilus]